MNETLELPGLGSVPIVRAPSVSDAGRLVRECRAAGKAVYPVGGRTMLDLGLPAKRPGIALDTTALDAVIDYPARDMTITVQAGLTIAQLDRVLERENQWLPVDVPLPARATLGGAIAANASGPHRLGHGTLRDAVIGIGFLTDDGVEVKGGGRVVKNVAGYDFMKLQTGALGTLGLITHVTLKVKPRPEATATVAFGCRSAELDGVLDLLHKSNSRPVAIELLNAAAWAETGAASIPGDWILLVGFGEKRVTVDWQKKTLLDELKRDVRDLFGLWQTVTDLQVRPASRFIGKASVRPSQVAEFANRFNRGDALIHSQPMNGIVWLHTDERPGPDFVLRRGATKPAKTGADWELMKHVKTTLDPDNVFNPGRLW
ncbi:MAG: FAD-binding oxidoreductase [Gemmataceae bacterium]|nr:FAD-binding oxidoreductase [Gemmataceae bacterium]